MKNDMGGTCSTVVGEEWDTHIGFWCGDLRKESTWKTLTYIRGRYKSVF